MEITINDPNTEDTVEADKNSELKSDIEDLKLSIGKVESKIENESLRIIQWIVIVGVGLLVTQVTMWAYLVSNLK